MWKERGRNKSIEKNIPYFLKSHAWETVEGSKNTGGSDKGNMKFTFVL